jgi:hypothetical protein
MEKLYNELVDIKDIEIGDVVRAVGDPSTSITLTVGKDYTVVNVEEATLAGYSYYWLYIIDDKKNYRRCETLYFDVVDRPRKRRQQKLQKILNI